MYLQVCMYVIGKANICIPNTSLLAVFFQGSHAQDFGAPIESNERERTKMLPSTSLRSFKSLSLPL